MKKLENNSNTVQLETTTCFFRCIHFQLLFFIFIMLLCKKRTNVTLRLYYYEIFANSKYFNLNCFFLKSDLNYIFTIHSRIPQIHHPFIYFYLRNLVIFFFNVYTSYISSPFISLQYYIILSPLESRIFCFLSLICIINLFTN